MEFSFSLNDILYVGLTAATVYGSKFVFHDFSDAVSSRYTSSCCAILISALAYNNLIQESLVSFIAYLCFDTFVRKTPLILEMWIHHGLHFTLSFYGLILLRNFRHIYQINNGLLLIKTLLLMEATSPLLHFAWIARHYKLTVLSTVFFVFLLALWVPLRLIGPMHSITYTNFIFAQTSVELHIIKGLIIMLGLMQSYWFCQLCVLAVKTIRKSSKLNDGDGVLEQSPEKKETWTYGPNEKNL